MYKVKVYNKISDCGLECFPKESFIYSADIENPEGILVRSADLNSIDIEESVLAIARAGAGVNNIPVEKCTELGIPVFNTPGANANAVKEMVIAALYMSSRNIHEAISFIDTIKDRGDEIPKLVEDNKSQFVGPEVSNKALGIIGLGAVGVLVANAAIHLGLTVYGYDPYMTVENAWNLDSKVIRSKEIDELYRNCEYITIHVPLMKETRNIINSDSIAKMKDGVRILNFARGELVNSEDILKAVEAKKVACYVTDFPDKFLVDKKGIIAIPHLGASTPESEDNCAVMAVQELVNYIQSGTIKNSVNFPGCELPSSYISRMTIFAKDNSDILKAISTLAEEFGYTINSFINSNKNNSISYMVFDIDKTPDDLFISKVNDLPGVFRVRVIS